MLLANENGSCGRSETLVAYLYGELPEADAQAFAVHAGRCTQCGAELIELGGLHRSMSEWRTATVGQMAQPAIEPAVWMPDVAPAFVHARRSIWSVVAEFFTVAPMWARAGVAVAVLALIVLGVVYVLPSLRSNPSSVAGGGQPPLAPATPVDKNLTVTPPIGNGPVARNTPPAPVTPAPRVAPRLVAKGGPRRSVAPAVPNRDQNRELASLASDILLVNPNDRDNEIPRLSDLLTDGDVPKVEPNQ
jgi:anti-sigma factor RsiW